MYTVVFYNDETMEVVDTQESETIPNIGGAKWPYYIQEGAFDGVVDPSKAIDARSQIEILQEENEILKARVQSTEDAFFQFMMNNSEVPFI